MTRSETSPRGGIELADRQFLRRDALAGRRPGFGKRGFDIRDGRALDHHAGIALRFVADRRSSHSSPTHRPLTNATRPSMTSDLR